MRMDAVSHSPCPLFEGMWGKTSLHSSRMELRGRSLHVPDVKNVRTLGLLRLAPFIPGHDEPHWRGHRRLNLDQQVRDARATFLIGQDIVACEVVVQPGPLRLQFNAVSRQLAAFMFECQKLCGTPLVDLLSGRSPGAHARRRHPTMTRSPKELAPPAARPL